MGAGPATIRGPEPQAGRPPADGILAEIYAFARAFHYLSHARSTLGGGAGSGDRDFQRVRAGRRNVRTDGSQPCGRRCPRRGRVPVLRGNRCSPMTRKTSLGLIVGLVVAVL